MPLRLAVAAFAAVLLSSALLSAPAVAAPPHCPPGHAKKGWCGDRPVVVDPLHHRPYSVGRPLPPGVTYVVVRDYDRYRLAPPGRGYVYGRVDDDLLLIAETTRAVAAVVRILSD